MYYWNTIMQDIVDECVPQKKKRVRHKDIPYMTAAWKNAIRAKRRAFNKYLNERTQQNRQEKVKYRNEAVRQRRIAVRQYWKKKTSDLKENPRNFFETFKPFLGSRKGVMGTNINLKVDGKIISNQETVADILADHFATIASDIGDVKLRNSSETDLNNHPSVLQIQMANSSEPMIKSNPVFQLQVKNALESLNTRKASGCDNLPAKVLNYGAEKLAIPLANLYNSCITNRKWPSDWKRREWTPVFKKEDSQDSQNYRPITVRRVVSKVFEQLLSDQISKQFDSRLDPRITAYRKRRSCETTLISLIEAWKSARDNQPAVKILFTYLSKAFDHSILP